VPGLPITGIPSHTQMLQHSEQLKNPTAAADQVQQNSKQKRSESHDTIAAEDFHSSGAQAPY